MRPSRCVIDSARTSGCRRGSRRRPASRRTSSGRVDYTLVGVPVSANYDTTDSKLDPTRGVRLNASVTGFPTALGSTVDLVQAQARGSAYYSIDPESRFVLAGLVGLGAEGGANLADIPANWRFYAGGGGSVRGYAYNSLGPTGPYGLAVVGGRSLFYTSAELRVRVTDTIGIVPFFDAGNAFATSLPEFQRAAGHGGRRRPALLYGDRADPRRCRLSAPAARRQRVGRVLRQHRAGFLMMRRLLPGRLMALIVALIALSGQARATEADKGVLANLLSRALSSQTTSVSIGAVDGRAFLRRVDQRHRPFRPRRAVAQNRQGPADLEPARAVLAPARGRSADHRTHAGPAAPALLGNAAARDQRRIDPA